MINAHRLRVTIVATAGAGALALSGCSSSGGGTAPSQQKIEAKLKSDPEVKQALGASVGDNTTALNILYTCIAKAMRTDADAGDVSDYVNGKKSIDDVGQTKSDDKLKADLTACAKSSASSSAAVPSGAPSS